MGRTRIKICGICDAESAFAAVEAGADAVGFVFVKSSPRYIEPESAAEIAIALPPFVSTVALVADLKSKAFSELFGEYPYFDFAQLHGRETEVVVRECSQFGMDIIKALRYGEGMERELLVWNRIAELEALLIDGSSGGGGERFDWSGFAAVSGVSDHPLIIAGGLTAANVGDAIRTLSPWAVDVSSGVERERGLKDVGLIRSFCEAVRDADAGLR